METQFDTEEEIVHEITDYERERGKPMPSFQHSKAQRNLLFQMHNSANYEAFPELNLDLNGCKSVPDIAVFSKSNLSFKEDVVWVDVPPQLTVEILSPNQGLKSLFDKATKYLQNGVEEAWIVIPEIQSITVCKPGGVQKTFVEGSVTHESTGIVVDIAQTFSSFIG
ncbi:MAG: Uma2 family endonuclease [Candidatus Kapaibacterium sp.]|nr:MAG: Uma2 family endonuclease [Candidatus Kapabacteria bacterium]